jgi:hypothetical protein
MTHRARPTRLAWKLALALGACALAAPAVAAKPKQATEAAAPADPNEPVAKAHGGKVWVQPGSFPSQEGDRLREALAALPATGELPQSRKDGPWPINFLAVFKKASVKGPRTVQITEKQDKAVVDQSSIDNASASLVYQASFELSPDSGFNKGHAYVIKVGQILKGKFVPYAQGEFSLK